MYKIYSNALKINYLNYVILLDMIILKIILVKLYHNLFNIILNKHNILMTNKIVVKYYKYINILMTMDYILLMKMELQILIIIL